jgi:D-sedoheptulose 7-phosphate isomerase
MERAVLLSLEESIETKRSLKALVPAMTGAVKLIVKSLEKGGKVVIFGNGGSAADAQHIAAELVGRFEKERGALPAIALTTNTSNITALANDYEFSSIFQRQVEALVAPGDVAIGISTSGSSPNVIKALNAAKVRGASTIALTGEGGGHAGEIADLCLAVPSRRTCRIQECHITIGHIVCELVEKHFTREME